MRGPLFLCFRSKPSCPEKNQPPLPPLDRGVRKSKPPSARWERIAFLYPPLIREVRKNKSPSIGGERPAVGVAFLYPPVKGG